MSQDNLYQPISLMLKLTDYCPNNCLNGKYCFSGCSPDAKTWIRLDRFDDFFMQAKEAGIRELCYVSSEPFSDVDFLVEVTRKASRAGIVPRFLVTNGRIGESYPRVLESFKRIKDAGFTMSVDDSYAGSGYNGIDVSVDQFHRIPSRSLSNTILSALEVFGPTIFVSIRNTVPNQRIVDHTTLNEVIRNLQDSQKFSFLNHPTREVVFADGSRVMITEINAEKFGNAKCLPDDFFTWTQFSLQHPLVMTYKDIREAWEMDYQRGKFSVFPFHKLYIDPDGETYPELGRFPVLGGGNIYDISLKQSIDNIDKNPLFTLLATTGFSGLLCLLSRFGLNLDLYSTGDIHLHDRYLSQTESMERLKNAIRESGLEEKLRSEEIPELQRKRDLILRSKIVSVHDKGNASQN